MFCMYCQHDVIECTCPDIEQRLKALASDAVMGMAANQNFKIRRAMNPTPERAKVERRH